MEVEAKGNRRKLVRARRRVEQLKGFYVHLAVYIVVNLFITAMKVGRNINNGETFSEAIWDFGTFAVWFFWGIGLAFHAAKTFSYNPFFGKDWEERQIRKYMEEDREELKKFR